MNTVETGIESYAPIVEVAPVRPEESKIYEMCWNNPAYRLVAPGEHAVHTFLEQARPKELATVLDIGCGTGRGSLGLALFGTMDVTMIDFTDNCLDDDIRPMLETQKHVMRFVKADINAPLPVAAHYGYCTDVMEHIAPENVDRVLSNILHACEKVFFQISCVDDVMGKEIGFPLHLTVKPHGWWLQKLQDHGCTVLWSKDGGEYCQFYVTAWIGAKELVDVGVLNVGVEQIKANVLNNVKLGFGQIKPHETNDMEVMILGGGPSLDLYRDEIIALRASGVKLITMNGSYNWALKNGLVPSAQVVVDARAFNARFVQPVVENCRYLIASQCDPSVFEGLPKDMTLLWNTSCSDIIEILNENVEEWYGIPGGSTVLLRTIPMMRMLGYRKFHLYGCDSCVSSDGAHHAYDQPENNDEYVLPVTVGDRVFRCTTWQCSQAQEFMDLIKVFGNEIELDVHGDGLLAYIIKHAADLADRDDWLK